MKQVQQGQWSGRKIVLNFDINKTICLADAQYPNMTKEECLMEILVGYAWGKLEQRDEKSPVQWKLMHPTFSAVSPDSSMQSYKEYVISLYPYKTVKDEPNAEKMKEYNSTMNEQRRALYYTFVKQQGGPCVKLKPEYDRIVKQITLPKAVIEELKIKQEESVDSQTPDLLKKKTLAALLQEKDNLSDLFTDGKFNIIPTFYKTIINLKKQKKEFAIVFRPFGTDPKNILREFNKFCMGEHPCYSGRNNTPIVKFDGSKGSKNYIVLEKQSGIFYRFDKETTSVVMGTLRRSDKKKPLEDEYEKEIEEESVSLLKNTSQIYLHMMESLKENCGLCLQDDYEFYAGNQYRNEDSAKLLYVDQTDYDTLHIFFDDNIIDDDQQNLIEVIDVVTNEKIPRKKCLNKYLVKVDIIDAIRDQDYFIKLIEQCDKLRSEEIERLEKGITDEIVEGPKKTEWELLQESNDSEYLRKTILPLLQPALQLVDLERPKDPITFIALYCLKNKDKVKIPQPTQEYLDSLNQQKEEEVEEQKHQEVHQPVAEVKQEQQQPPAQKKK